MAMILSTPVMDTFSPDQLPGTLFNYGSDSYGDADSFFNFDDACVEGPVPEVEEETAQNPETAIEEALISQLSESQISDGSLFGGNGNSNDGSLLKYEQEEGKPAQVATINPNVLFITLPGTPPPLKQEQRQLTPPTTDATALVLPSIEPTELKQEFKPEFQQDFQQELRQEPTPFVDDPKLQALFEEFEGPIAEALQLPTAAPTPAPGAVPCVGTSWPSPPPSVPWPCFDGLESSGDTAWDLNNNSAAGLGSGGGGGGEDLFASPPPRDMFAYQQPCGDHPSSVLGDAREVFDLDTFDFDDSNRETVTYDGLESYSPANVKQEAPNFDGFAFSNVKREPASSAAFFHPSPKTTTDVFTAPPPPQSQHHLTPKPEFAPLVPDLAQVSAAGQVSCNYDDESVNFLYSLPLFTPLTTPQSIPRSVPATTSTPAAVATARLVHPKPRSPPFSADFIHRHSLSTAPTDVLPYSILNREGLFEAGILNPPSYLTPAHTPSRDLTTPVVNGKILKRIPKPAKAKDVDVSDWYDSLPEAPTAWGGHDHTKPMFQYNKEGELLPNLRFTREQILYYIRERKQQGLPLTLWIQNVPHGCKTRVGDDRLRACRWSGCPAYKGTILKGFWRVCFDERPETSGKQHDPYHNAGYMHLWCMDRCFDLLEIAQAFDLKPDTRYFEKEERNPMAMIRDHDELVMEFEEWRTSQQAAYEEWQRSAETNKMMGLPVQNRQVGREAKLWYVLTTKHLALETPVRSNMRKKRNGISIDKHKGDLDWYVERVNEKKVSKKGHSIVEELDSDDDEGGQKTPATRAARPSIIEKRKREVYEYDDNNNASQPQTAATRNKRVKQSCYSPVERR
ncbi:hypothetical protein CPAR01_03271 [Colletotrichum paranaense]|uniref:AT hook domain-containing protein n=1 Tax=Colletotrichum paranaense TaxID=1914294 RepID=A0ABQ9T2P6_9PEZI|nr:uncharacterized protein CPAR01_03271 [Colletotrichum paranaense]KAK1545769.1 hypothetical protein CPAR01_03271 [Colletotrichum paranaense]